MQALYEQSLHIKSAIPHPLIMGVIRGRYYVVLCSSGYLTQFKDFGLTFFSISVNLIMCL